MQGRIERLAGCGEALAEILAPMREVETVVAIVAAAGIKPGPAQHIGEFGILMPAIRANQNDARGRLKLPQIEIRHGGRPFGTACADAVRIGASLSGRRDCASARRSYAGNYPQS